MECCKHAYKQQQYAHIENQSVQRAGENQFLAPFRELVGIVGLVCLSESSCSLTRENVLSVMALTEKKSVPPESTQINSMDQSA